MSQAPKPKSRRKLPESVLRKDDHDLMETIFGKRIMRRVDEFLKGEKTEKDNMNG